ncbi:MAG TPA: thiol-disulfide isomerase [Blastocatellia bacterium]|nr:thiol-disulfide isomerase [Blastocatellia bacterium]
MKIFRVTLLAFTCVIAAGISAHQVSQASGNKMAAKPVTFNKDVAPIVFKSCAECHRPGEPAPFSMLSYKEIRPWARAIKEQVVNKKMPRWDANPAHQKFANDPRLTQKEIDTIAAWVDGGAIEGNVKDLPPVPKFTAGWNIGKPDLILTMPEEFTLEASGPDEYQYFEIPTSFTEDKYIQAVEARPGNRQVVHHIIAFIKPPQKENPNRPKLSKEEIAKLRAEAEKQSIQYQEGFLRRTKPDAPFYNDGCNIPPEEYKKRRVEGGEGGGNNNNWLIGYAPGNITQPWPEGTVKKIPAGSSIVFQVHYSKVAGSVQKDRSSVGLIFAKAPPKKEIMMAGVANPFMKLEPGQANQKVTACWTTKEDIHIYTLTPHMHVRGTAQRIEAIYPNGKSEVLLDVPTYSFAWQTTYELKEPKAIPKGTRFLVTTWYDNSPKNKFNPDPTKAVRWGDPTYDEMMIGFIEYTIDNQNLKGTTAMK